MKYIQLSVSDHKIDFLMELLRSLDFITIESVSSSDLPRVYPGLNLEKSPAPAPRASLAEGKAAPVDMEELRSIMKKVEQMRDLK